MIHLMRRSSGLTLGELLVICLVLVIIAAIAIPGLLSSHRATNEQQAAALLKTLCGAEADFRMNDRDKNRVADFWTAPVIASAARAAPEKERTAAARPEAAANAAVARFIISFPR